MLFVHVFINYVIFILRNVKYQFTQNIQIT